MHTRQQSNSTQGQGTLHTTPNGYYYIYRCYLTHTLLGTSVPTTQLTSPRPILPEWHKWVKPFFTGSTRRLEATGDRRRELSQSTVRTPVPVYDTACAQAIEEWARASHSLLDGAEACGAGGRWPSGGGGWVVGEACAGIVGVLGPMTDAGDGDMGGRMMGWPAVWRMKSGRGEGVWVRFGEFGEMGGGKGEMGKRGQERGRGQARRHFHDVTDGDDATARRRTTPNQEMS